MIFCRGDPLYYYKTSKLEGKISGRRIFEELNRAGVYQEFFEYPYKEIFEIIPKSSIKMKQLENLKQFIANQSINIDAIIKELENSQIIRETSHILLPNQSLHYEICDFHVLAAFNFVDGITENLATKFEGFRFEELVRCIIEERKELNTLEKIFSDLNNIEKNYNNLKVFRGVWFKMEEKKNQKKMI